jgi:hypothetical protein
MPEWYGLGVHGTTVVAEGPGNLEQVNGIPWTDVLGLRRGWGTMFRGKWNTFNRFHFAVPTLELRNHTSADLGEVSVSFIASGTAKVQSVHIWSGAHRLKAFDNLGAAGDFHAPVSGKNFFLFYPELKMTDGALGISIGVDFGAQSSNIEFHSGVRTIRNSLIPGVAGSVLDRDRRRGWPAHGSRGNPVVRAKSTGLDEPMHGLAGERCGGVDGRGAWAFRTFSAARIST